MATASAILLDVGGVMLFPSPDVMLPPLRSAGVDPSPADLIRAHYRAMADAEKFEQQRPVTSGWWAAYLCGYVSACGVPADAVAPLADQMAQTIRGFTWTHVGPGVREALPAIAALGLPLGIVSNADGEVQKWLSRLGLCYEASPATAALDGPAGTGPTRTGPARTGPARTELAGTGPAGTGPARTEPARTEPARTGSAPQAEPAQAGIEVGVVVDSAVVGIAKPDPGIFAIALDALAVPAGRRATVIHVGDALRYDVAGALAAGIIPVHLDPFGDCQAPEGHHHIRHLADLIPLTTALA